MQVAAIIPEPTPPRSTAPLPTRLQETAVAKLKSGDPKIQAKPRVGKCSASRLAAGKRNYAKYRLKKLQHKTLVKLNSGDPEVRATLKKFTIEKHRCRFDANTQQWVGDRV